MTNPPMKKTDEAELLAWLDGDLTPERRAEIQQQLEADWELRTTLAQLERRIGKYIEATAHQSPAEIEPFDDFWERLAPQLEGAPSPTSVRSTIPQMFARWVNAFAMLPHHWRLVSVAGTVLLMAAALIAALSLSSRVRPVAAEELLQRAIQGEELRLRQLPEPVVYRKLQIKRSGAAFTWESWNDAKRQQVRQRVHEKEAAAVLAELEGILRANHFDAQNPLSAAAFAAWRKAIKPKAEAVATNGNEHTLTTTVQTPVALNAITEAALVVRKNDWHAVALQLRVQADNEIRAYELRETAYEVLPAQALAALAEAALTGTALAKASPSPSPASTASPIAFPSASVAGTPLATASAELEVEVLERLNRANALLGEQLTLTRTSDGKLLIEGIVETDARKRELLAALQSVTSTPTVKVDLSTVAEAAARQTASAPRKVIIQDAQVAQQSIPVEMELRSYFSPRIAAGERVEQELQRFSAQICSRSSRARAHALALKQIADRFTAAQLQALEPATRERWRALLAQHAQGYRREWQTLRQQLQPMFPLAANASTAEGKLSNDDELLSAINRLFKLAATNDAALCQSFSISTEAVTTAAVKRAEFWRAVGSAETLAAQIANWQ